jgi:hypothetical protein
MKNIVPLGLLFAVVFMMIGLGVAHGDFDARSALVKRGLVESVPSPDEHWRRCHAHCFPDRVAVFAFVCDDTGSAVSSCHCESELEPDDRAEAPLRTRDTL